MSSEAVSAVTDLGERRRNRRQEETIRKVLDAAVELLRETSYSDLTMRMVAARAGVSPATAYTYFRSKNALIAEVYLRLVREVPTSTRPRSSG
jgi:AcrR family transcriptional regulator